jgi:hypothetical protein
MNTEGCEEATNLALEAQNKSKIIAEYCRQNEEDCL